MPNLLARGTTTTSTSKSTSTATSSSHSSTATGDHDCTKNKNSQYCTTGNTQPTLAICLAVIIPIVFIAALLGYFLWRSYKRNKKESLEDDDPDFNGDNIQLPDMTENEKAMVQGHGHGGGVAGIGGVADYGDSPYRSVYNMSHSQLPSVSGGNGGGNGGANPFRDPNAQYQYRHNANGSQMSLGSNQIAANSVAAASNARVDSIVLPYAQETNSKHSLEELSRQLGGDYAGYRLTDRHFTANNGSTNSLTNSRHTSMSSQQFVQLRSDGAIKSTVQQSPEKSVQSNPSSLPYSETGENGVHQISPLRQPQVAHTRDTYDVPEYHTNGSTSASTAATANAGAAAAKSPFDDEHSHSFQQAQRSSDTSSDVDHSNGMSQGTYQTPTESVRSGDSVVRKSVRDQTPTPGEAEISDDDLHFAAASKSVATGANAEYSYTQSPTKSSTTRSSPTKYEPSPAKSQRGVYATTSADDGRQSTTTSFKSASQYADATDATVEPQLDFTSARPSASASASASAGAADNREFQQPTRQESQHARNDSEPDLTNNGDDDLSPEEEEQIKRMKSVYKVYFSRENSIKSKNSQTKFEVSPAEGLPPLPKMSNIGADVHYNTDDTRDVDASYNHDDQNYPAPTRGKPQLTVVTNGAAGPQHQYSQPQHQQQQQPQQFAAGAAANGDVNRQSVASYSSSVYVPTSTVPNPAEGYYPHQQIQYMLEQQTQQRQYGGRGYPQQQPQQPQPQPVVQTNPVEAPRRRKLENLPSPHQFSNRNSTLDTFVGFNPQRGYTAKYVQQQQQETAHSPVTSPTIDQQQWARQPVSAGSKSSGTRKPSPHDIDESMMIHSPVDIQPSRHYAPKGSISRTASSSQLSSPTVPYFQDGQFQRPHGAENLVPRSGSQQDLRKAMDQANL